MSNSGSRKVKPMTNKTIRDLIEAGRECIKSKDLGYSGLVSLEDYAEDKGRLADKCMSALPALEQLLAEREAMQIKLKKYARQLDQKHGTPCAAIRWQQEREELQSRLEQLLEGREKSDKEISDLVFQFLEERALTADDHAKQLMFHFGKYLLTPPQKEEG